jgi:glutathione S-transferase
MDDRRLMPATAAERIEVRRLMAWFNEKFFEEASNPLVTERIYKRFMSEDNGGGAPAADVIRAAKTNVRYHLAYIGWLAQTRNYLAGDKLTYADIAAAAHLSAIDYLVIPPAAQRMAGRRAGVAHLCGSRFLIRTSVSKADISSAEAHPLSRSANGGLG